MAKTILSKPQAAVFASTPRRGVGAAQVPLKQPQQRLKIPPAFLSPLPPLRVS